MALDSSNIFNSSCELQQAQLAILTAPWSYSKLHEEGPGFLIKYSQYCSLRDEKIFNLKQKIFSFQESKDFIDIYKNKNYFKYQEIINSRLTHLISHKIPYGIIGGDIDCCISSLEKYNQIYPNLGLLHLGPYNIKFNNIGINRIINFTLQKITPPDKPDSVEIFNHKYLEWMKNSENGWGTVAFDIVAGLPKFIWLSVNLQLLHAMDLSYWEKLLQTLIDQRVTLVGFSVYNVELQDPLKSHMVSLFHKLCCCLLITQGVMLNTKDDWYDGLNDSAEDDVYPCTYTSTPLPKQGGSMSDTLNYTDRY